MVPFRASGLLALAFVCPLLPAGLFAETFEAPGVAIPNGDPSGVDIEFDVTGLTSPVGRVQVSLTLDHPHQGDVTATLLSPRGEARLVLFGRVGYRPIAFGGNSGVDANFDGTYHFDDFATLDLWQETRALVGSQAVVPAGTYRTSTPAPVEGGVLSNAGGCASHLSTVFSGLTAEQANGTWKINVADLDASEAGSVVGATLTIDPLAQSTLYVDSFENSGPDGSIPFARNAPRNPILVSGSNLRGSCNRAQFDFTGTGRTSYSVVRDNVEPDEQGHTLLWVVRSNGSSNDPDQQFLFGDASSDIIMPDDFDGDGIADAAVWSAQAGFRIRRSSRPADVVVLDLGQPNDDPNQAGDYDGDGVADVALVRFPISNGKGRVVIAGSTSPLVGGFPLLNGSFFDTFATGGLDLTGDGIADIPVQTENPGGSGTGLFTVYSGDGGGAVDSFVFGDATDIIVPGNRAGDGRADTTLGGSDSGDRVWTVRDSQTGAVGPPTIFGRASDFMLGGDFDGDGLDDLAVFRPDSNPGDSKFLIRPSSGGDDFEVRFGDNQDTPVPATRVH